MSCSPVTGQVLMKELKSTYHLHFKNQNKEVWGVKNAKEGDVIMVSRSLLDGKRILIVDDEPDVLEMLEDLLSMCDTVKATSFNVDRFPTN